VPSTLFAVVTAKRKKQFFKPRWKDHFTFSLRERRGFYMMIILLMIEISWIYYLRYVYRPELPEDWARIVAVGDSLLAINSRVDTVLLGSEERPVAHINPKALVSFFEFDPNKLSLEGWKKLGISEKQARAIVRFRERGMVFRVKNDLLKIKVVDQSRIRSWLPFVQLPDSLTSRKISLERTKPVLVDIASADSVALVGLRGIGPALAGRIIKYRNRLGGFLSTDQLREVYGISDSVWAILAPQIVLQKGSVQHLFNLNEVSEDSLRIHPYVGSKLARQICAYRKQHLFRSVDEIRSLPLVTEEIYRKIAPYLKL